MNLIEIGLDLCKEIGGDTYIVGGAVRDLVMGREVHDIDIATNVSIEDIEKRFETYQIGKNKDFGIILVKYMGIDFEVAHFRSDGQYLDGRHPDTVNFVNTIEEDLARRDFTINAMAYDGQKIIDPYGGIDDINKKVIRFVGDPKKRIEEDGLRVLRAYRFAARFKFEIEEFSSLAMNYHSFDNISQERITQEIIKVAGDGSKCLAYFLHRTYHNGIIVLTQIQDHSLKHQLKYHPEGDVFDHIIHCLSIENSKDYLLNLCILFHDIGKYYTLVYRDGNPTYYGHDSDGVKYMQELGKKLKLSNEDIDTICYVIKNHMIRRNIPQMSKSKVIPIITHKDYHYLEKTCLADELSNLYKGDQDRHNSIARIVVDLLFEYKSKRVVDERMKSLFTGKDIMMLRPELVGKEIGVVQKATYDHILNNRNIQVEDVFSFIINYDV